MHEVATGRSGILRIPEPATEVTGRVNNVPGASRDTSRATSIELAFVPEATHNRLKKPTDPRATCRRRMGGPPVATVR